MRVSQMIVDMHIHMYSNTTDIDGNNKVFIIKRFQYTKSFKGYTYLYRPLCLYLLLHCQSFRGKIFTNGVQFT